MMSDMSSVSECTMHGALPLVLRASRALGVAPVRLARALGGGWSARVALRLLPYSYFHLFVFSGYSLVSLLLRYQANIDISLKVYDFGDVMWTLLIIQLGGTVVVGVLGVRSRMDTILSSLNVIEPIHVHYRSEKLLRKVYVKESIFVIACSTHVILDVIRWFFFYICIIVQPDQIDIWKIVFPGYLYLFSLSTMLLAQFALPALRVTAALAAMNHALRELLYLVDLQTTGLRDLNTVLIQSIIVDTMRVDHKFNQRVRPLYGNICGSIRHLSTCYEAVQRAVTRLNDSFGFVLILIYGFLLIFITATPYSIILLHLKEDVGLLYSLGEVLDLLMYFFCILVGVQPGHEIEQEVSYMRCTVSELLSRAASRAVQGERGDRGERGDDAETLTFLLGVLSKQLTVPDLCFAPLKIFKLRRPFVFVLIATSVTLTLVLIQFKGLLT